MKEWFRKAAAKVSLWSGSALAFLLATLVVVVWALTGPLFGFSDTWQLFINTGTTVATFLMVFLIQNTQNRDSLAMHAKLDELLIATEGARNRMAVAEDLSDDELTELSAEFHEKAGEEFAEAAEEMEDAGADRAAKQEPTSGVRSG